jgi:ribosomal protein S27AE
MKLEKYILNSQKRGLDIPLDITSNRYRCCPNCLYEFMAEDLKEKYCCDKCRYDFNNELKTLASEAVLADPVEEGSDLSVLQPEHTIVNKETILENNVANLWELFEKKGREYYISFAEMVRKGIDLSVNNGQGELYNTSESANCKFLIIGPFHIFRVSLDVALIVKPKTKYIC